MYIPKYKIGDIIGYEDASLISSIKEIQINVNDKFGVILYFLNDPDNTGIYEEEAVQYARKN